MKSRFVRVSWGFEHTDVFLNTYTIKSYIQSFQQGREVDQNTKMLEEIALTSQDRMDEEINQTIRTCDDLTKQELFEYLIGWIRYFEYNLNKTENILKSIEDYNEKKLIEFEDIVRVNEEKFKETIQYKTLNHLEFYEVEYGASMLLGAIRQLLPPQKRLVEYRKYIETPDPDLIDIAYFPQYIDVIKPIISRCINIASNRLSYLNGGNKLKQLPDSPPKLIESPIPDSQSSRLKVNLTVEQLTMLFRLFKDCKIINAKYDKEIHAFIADNFETPSLEGKKISAKNVGKLFSSTDTDVLNYWIAKFTELSKKAGQK